MHFLVTVAVLMQTPDSAPEAKTIRRATAELEAAERTRGADVIEDPVAAVAAGWTARRNLAFFARAAAVVSDGKLALARVDLARAEQLFADAEQIYAAEAARPGVRDEWAEAAKWRGVALFELKRRDEAATAWQRAKALARDVELTEAMVRPEVARAFAATAPSAWKPPVTAAASGDDAMMRTLAIDEFVVAAVALDGETIHYAAARRAHDCSTEAIEGTRADEIVRRLHEAACKPGANVEVKAPVIAPRPTIVVERRTPVWRRPWLWLTVVGALGVGVVVAVNLWPRDASYSATLDFHQFALGAR